jgi:hypothetical protein
VVSNMRSPGMSRAFALIERSYSKRLELASQMDSGFETAPNSLMLTVSCSELSAWQILRTTAQESESNPEGVHVGACTFKTPTPNSSMQSENENAKQE